MLERVDYLPTRDPNIIKIDHGVPSEIVDMEVARGTLESVESRLAELNRELQSIRNGEIDKEKIIDEVQNIIKKKDIIHNRVNGALGIVKDFLESFQKT